MRLSRPSPLVLASLAAIAGSVLAPGAVSADPISLSRDQVRVVTFNRPIKTVFVANPLIADITVIDSTRVFVQGKNLGTTQLLALDENGRETFNDQVTVMNPPGAVVTLQRGRGQETLACMDDRCQVAPGVVGDAPDAFDQTLGQMAKSDAAKRAGGN